MGLARGLALTVAIGLATACSPAAPERPRTEIASPAPIAASAEPSAPTAAPPEIAPSFDGDVLTDTRDVRACLPLDGGVVLAGTGGGLLLVRADGTTRAPWTALDGLPETRVHALLRDGDRLWIGTEGGLAAARLRGERLVVERSIAGKPVRALALHDGAIVVATWGGGLARVDEKDNLDPLRGPNDKPELRFGALAAHDGTLYAGAPTGLYRVSGREVAKVAGAPASIWSLASHGGRLWIGGVTGLSSMARGRFQPESDADVRALAPLGDSGTNSNTNINTNTILAGTFGQGAMEITNGRARSISGLGAAPFVHAIASSGDTRCAGGPDGLFVQRGAAPWRAVRVPELASNDVSALARDGDRLWIGTFDRGLAVLEGGRAVRVRDPALDDKINALAIERAGAEARVWVATARGLALVEPRGKGFRVTRYGEIDGLPSNDVHAVIALSSGGALAGTARGAALVTGGRVTPLTEKRGIPGGGVWAVAEGPNGTLLLGTSRGLLVGDVESRGVVFRGAPERRDASEGAPKPWIQLTMATGDLEDDWITALAVRGRTIYAGTYNAGVTAMTMDEAGAFTARHLGGGYVNPGGLLVKGGSLYAATMNGLLARPAEGEGAWRAVTRAAPGKDVTAVVPAGDRLWVASRRGLALFTPPTARGAIARAR